MRHSRLGFGSLTLFGQARKYEFFAQHVPASESWTTTQGHGRTVHEWTLLPSKPDNHWLDCLAGCAVAASMAGSTCLGRWRRGDSGSSTARMI